MPSSESFRRGFALPKSPLQISSQIHSGKRLFDYWKLLNHSWLNQFRPRPSIWSVHRRLVSLFVSLAIFMIAGKALAQRPIGIDVSDYQTNDNISWTTLNNTYGISF